MRIYQLLPICVLLLPFAAPSQQPQEPAPLIAVLRNPASDAIAKMTACRALGKMGPRARAAVPALMLLLRDPDRDTRDAAITALYRIGPDSQPAIPVLEEVAASDPDGLLRSLATSAIEMIRGGGNQPAPSPPPRRTVAAQPPPSARGARRLPQGFTSRAAGTGHALSAQWQAGRGRDALRQAFESLGSYFDQRPRALRAIESVDGRAIQVLFTASLDRQPVRGFASADAGNISIVFDRADRFAQSAAAYGQGAPAAAARPRQVQLHPVRFSTGTLNLPDGWRIISSQVGVSAEGPEGNLDFGIYVQAYTPQAVANYPPQLRPPVVLDYGDCAMGLAQLGAKWGVLQNMRVIERAPSPGWDGPAEFIHFQGDSQGRAIEAFALILEKPVGPGTFMFYYSQVVTAAGQFARNFPVLMQIWQSWKTDDRVFRQRLDNAIRSMNECTRIIQEANANRQAAAERGTIAWDHIIRGTWPVEDTATGRRADFYQDIEPAIRRLNEAEGWERWRAVPYGELNQ